MTVHALAHAHTDLVLGACIPAGEHSRPCRRDSCAGPSRPRPPSERCAARGPSGSPCRVCGLARCVRSWSKAAPRRCHRTARPASRGRSFSSRAVVQDKPAIDWFETVERTKTKNHQSGDFKTLFNSREMMNFLEKKSLNWLLELRPLKNAWKHATNVLLRRLSTWCSTQDWFKCDHIALLILYTTTASQHKIVFNHQRWNEPWFLLHNYSVEAWSRTLSSVLIVGRPEVESLLCCHVINEAGLANFYFQCSHLYCTFKPCDSFRITASKTHSHLCRHLQAEARENWLCLNGTGTPKVLLAIKICFPMIDSMVATAMWFEEKKTRQGQPIKWPSDIRQPWSVFLKATRHSQYCSGLKSFPLKHSWPLCVIFLLINRWLDQQNWPTKLAFDLIATKKMLF